MRDDRFVGDVSGVFVARVLPTDGVTHTVAQVNACVSEADARESSCQEHLALGFEVVWVLDSSGEVLDGATKSLEREDVGDGVGALVSRAVDGV